ncbi:hypothetical protein EDD17DRAFT_1772089 [Pisolithus thermaeus]|nr:hypothetical protein EDD17DRAFT_1772089 [Pisolithus thermaeus]
MFHTLPLQGGDPFDPNHPNIPDGGSDGGGSGDRGIPEDPAEPPDNPLLALTRAIHMLACSSQCSGDSTPKTKVQEPDTFNGSNPKKLHEFLVQLRVGGELRSLQLEEFLGQVQDLLGYLEEVVEYGKAQGIMDTLSLVQIAINGAPPLTGKLWCFLIVNTPVLEQWDSFKALITLQYPEIKPAKGILKHFEEFYSYLDEARHSELSLVPALGDYLQQF